MKKILFVLLAWLPLLTAAQLKQEYIWQVYREDDSKRSINLSTNLIHGGYKIDADSLKANRLVLRLTELQPLARILKKKYNLSVTLLTGEIKILNGKQIKQQLHQQQQVFLAGCESGIDREAAMTNFSKALAGKERYRGPLPPFWHLDFGPVTAYNEEFRFVLSRKKRPLAYLDFALVTGDMARKLQQYEVAECVPVDRYLEFLNLKPLTNQDVPAKPHMLARGRYFTKVFRLNFAHNSAAYDQQEVNQIVNYLQDSSLTIKRIYIRGMSSIEGDSLHNVELQRQRAASLWQVLKPYADDGLVIEGDYKEAWLQFRTQMKAAGITEFDSLTNAAVRQLFSDPAYRQQYQGYLQKQRLAKLYLRLFRAYTPEQTVQAAAKTARDQYAKLLQAAKVKARSEKERQKRQAIARILGIEEALAEDVRLGKLSRQTVMANYPFSWFNDADLQMARFYLMRRNWAKGLEPVLLPVEDILMTAYQVTLPAVTSPYFSDSNRPLRRAVGVQMFAYHLIRKGEIPVDLYYRLTYPDEPRYYHLVMNKLYFKDNHLTNLEAQRNPVALVSASEGATTTTADASRYYFYLKKRLLVGTEIDAQVIRKDHYFFFDIYDLLYPNIYGWNEYDSTFYDPEIGVETMGMLIDRMLPTRLCPYQSYQMALDYHLKVLHRATLATEPDEQIMKSYKFVTKYYIHKAERLDAKAAYDVAALLVFLNHLFYKQGNVENAYRIVYPAFARGKLDERQFWFFVDLSYAIGRYAEDEKIINKKYQKYDQY